MTTNGGKLLYWIMSALLVLLMTALGAGVSAVHNRVTILEDSKSQLGLDINDIKWDVKRTREDMCRLERKIDDLREDITGKRVFRTPCP